MAGENPFVAWFDALADVKTQARIAARIDRLAVGNLGDVKRVSQGVSELRLDFGPGYRIYFAMVGRSAVLLLCAGSKRRQAPDIARAIGYLKDFHQRSSRL